MSPAGKIINIDSFKKKQSGIIQGSKYGGAGNGHGKNGAAGFVFLLAGVVVASLTLMMTPARKGNIPALPVGSIAPHNIKAPEDMLVEDPESTEQNREHATQSTFDVYDFDSDAARKAAQRLDEAFKIMAKGYTAYAGDAYKVALEGLERDEIRSRETALADDAPQETNDYHRQLTKAKSALAEFEKSAAYTDLEKQFTETLGAQLDDKSIRTLRYYHYRPKIAETVVTVITPLLKRGIVASKSQLPASSSKGITMRGLSTKAVQVVKNLEIISDVPSAVNSSGEHTARLVPSQRPGLRRLIGQLAEKFLEPDLTFNRKETELLKYEAAQEVKPVFFKLQRGEMIIREGERVTPVHSAKLAHLAGKVEKRGVMETLVGTTLFNALLVGMALLFIWKYHEEAREYPKIQVLLALLLVAHMAFIWAAVHLFTLFIQQTPNITFQAYLLSAPLVFGPMVVSIFFSVELSVLFTVVVSALTGIMLRDYPVLALLTIVGGMVCAYQVRSYNKRSAVSRAGLLVAFANIVVVLAFEMISSGSLFGGTEYAVLFAFLGGASSALFVSGVLPIVESMFPVVSDIKLLELTSLNHPLLRRMILEAPGTYHHSMMVGNLAEEAAKAIGANALLAKAGALFHDIGKMKKSEYFAENQLNAQNPHDKLTPSMSTLILLNHIKDGLELARRNKLLPQITAMIPEHHGTQLVRVFYHKAKQAEDASRDEVREEDFRYPGPIPSSRESACVALADSMEAAARACPDPSTQRLKELVKDVINDKFVQGQLDNSHLTLQGLALIAESFVHTLNGIHHHRLQYPDQPNGDKQDNGRKDTQTANGSQADGYNPAP